MSYPKKLLRLRPTQGIVADTPSAEVGPAFYTTGQNVIFRNGFASRIPGSRAAYDALSTDPILHLVNVRLGGNNSWVAAGPSTTVAVDTVGETDVTISGGLSATTDPYEWASAVLNGIPILTNGLNLPMYWDGNTANDFVALPDFPATTACKSLATFRYHVFALDIDGPGGHFESQVKWSDAAEPGTVPASWTPAADNEAGDTELSDTPGPVLCAHTLGGVLLIYKRSAVYQCDYVGGNQVFEFRKALANIGALTPRAVVELNGQHLVVTDGDIILTDGVNVRSIGEARQKRFLFNNLDQENYLNLFVAYNRAKGEAWICFPESGSQFCTKALVYDVAHDAFGVRDLDNVTCAALGIVDDETPSQFWDDDSGFWDDDSEVWNASGFSAALDSFVTASDNQITQHDADDAVTLQSLVGKYDLTFDEPERIKFVRRLHVRTVSGSGTLLARVGSRMTPADVISWGDEVTLAEPDQIVNVSIAGRYISVEVRAVASDVWTITAVDIEAEVRGYH
jgi:hypothetical protein